MSAVVGKHATAIMKQHEHEANRHQALEAHVPLRGVWVAQLATVCALIGCGSSADRTVLGAFCTCPGAPEATVNILSMLLFT